jgi:single-strand DNA-binding protein
MNGINRVTLVGRVGKDPAVGAVGQGGTKVAEFTLATSETFADRAGEKQERTEWHICKAWGPLADQVEKVVSKGRLLYLEGKVRTRSYTPSGSTEKRYITEIELSEFQMLDPKPEGRESRQDAPQPSAPPAQPRGGQSRTPSQASAPQGGYGYPAGNGSDVPF